MPAAWGADGPPALITLQVGAKAIQVEYAKAPRDLRRGLMGRRTLAPDGGMLFELGASEIQCFWMKDTLIPLSIAFIGANGKIVDIQAMQPLDLSPHCPPVAITRALEMNLGWFKQMQVEIGSAVKVVGP